MFTMDENTISDVELFASLNEHQDIFTEEFFQKAKEGDGKTFFEIGFIYFLMGNNSKALAWTHKAVLQNYIHAENAIGDIYSQTTNISDHMNVALSWYLKAAHKGHNKRLNEIASMYRKGDGIEKNVHVAIGWYTTSALQGDSKAAYSLGNIYQDEDAVKDLQKAVNWYQRACDNGNKDAEYEVHDLNAQGYFAKDDVKEDVSSVNRVSTKETDSFIFKQMEEKMNIFQDKIKVLEEENKQRDQKMKVAEDILRKLHTVSKDKQTMTVAPQNEPGELIRDVKVEPLDS